MPKGNQNWTIHRNQKLATQGIQDEGKQNKNNVIYVGHHYTQTKTNNVNKT